MFDLNKLHSIKIGLASPEQIHSWGKGEVTKPETINYRSQKKSSALLRTMNVIAAVIRSLLLPVRSAKSVTSK